MADTTVDLLVVGGGINGVGIARDAVGCGLSVMLVEQDDEEWALTADDVLWRRSKLGLHMDETQRAAVKAHLGA
jgi:glycerol-3-phosphate dehydrogenase